MPGDGIGEVALDTETDSSSLVETSGVFFWTYTSDKYEGQRVWKLTATQAADVKMIDTPTKLRKEGKV